MTNWIAKEMREEGYTKVGWSRREDKVNVLATIQ